MGELPTATITMLFSDVEGSTALLSRLGGGRYGEALSDQRAILRGLFCEFGGQEMGTEGDSFFVVFSSAAVCCCAHKGDDELVQVVDLRVGEPGAAAQFPQRDPGGLWVARLRSPADRDMA